MPTLNAQPGLNAALQTWLPVLGIGMCLIYRNWADMLAARQGQTASEWVVPV